MLTSDSDTPTRARVGCAGLPPRMSRGRYFQQLGFLELDALYRQEVKPAALRKWRRDAGDGARFSLVAPRLLGERGFRPSEQVRDARDRLLEAAALVDAEVIVLRTPPELSPSAANRAALRAFVDELRAGLDANRALAWEPRGVWDSTAARAFSAELGVTMVEDPLAPDPLGDAAPALADTAYLRLTGLGSARPHFSNDQLEDLGLALTSCERAWVVFANLEAFRDARRFAKQLTG